MPHSNYRIYSQGEYGIEPSDVSAVLGVASMEVGTLCTSDKINRWAIYKPLQYKGISKLTLAQRMEKNMGLSPASVTRLKDAYGVAKASLEAIESEIREWSYAKPMGGSTSPYRLGDFDGYDHESVACDSDWKDAQAAKGRATVPVANFSFRLNEESASNIGSANSNFMPLSYITSYDNWYLGLALYIPEKQGWMFICGTKSLKEATSSTIGSVLPTVNSSELVKDLLKDLDEVTYIPCLLANPQTAKVQEQAQRTYITMSAGTVYCMPSGAKSHKIYFHTAISNTMKQFLYNGMWVSAYQLSEAYYIRFNGRDERMAYLIKGKVDNATGRTLNGWFITTITMGDAAYGFQVKQIIVVYATVPGDGNLLDISSAPSEPISVENYLYCNKIVDIGPTANTRYEMYSYSLVANDISNTNKITVRTQYGDVSFYGYASTEVQVGLVVDCVR